MKIIIPNFPAPDTFAENVMVTLRAMGHDVLTPKYVPVGPVKQNVNSLKAEAFGRLFPTRLSAQEKWVRNASREYRPDMLLCLTQSIRPEILEDLRKIDVRRVAWWGDPAANMRGMGLLTDQWDVIFLKEQAAVRKFQSVRLNAHLLHEAMNPLWHRKCSRVIGNALIVVGNYYGFRQFLVLKLGAEGIPLHLYGPRPPRWSPCEIFADHKGRYITKHEKSRIFGEGIACLNSTALTEGDSVNCRAFEIAGAGGLHLFEDKDAIRQCFEPEREVLIYRSIDDVIEYFHRARKEPTWAAKIREAGWARAHSEHTYERRLNIILKLK
jgi:spore maturation protein CgeB